MAMTQSVKVMPNLDQQSTKVLNLTVLQRIDPFVEEILMTAAHVTFYEFNVDDNQWSRKDVEGSLFVVKRNTQPRFQFIVMNRRNTDNLVENILGDFEYEIQHPYLLYRNASQEVNGIWFYNSQDCEAVANLFSRILNAYSKVPPKPKVLPTKSEFEELEAIPNSSVIEGPLEPPTTSAATLTSDVPDDSFVNYFSGSISIGNASNSAMVGKAPVASSVIPLSSNVPNGIPSVLPVLQPASFPNSGAPLMPSLNINDSSSGNINRATNLIKPSLFSPATSAMVIPPIPSSTAMAPPLHPPVTVPRPYGAPLQPFAPPAPSASLAPAQNYNTVITRDRVHDALLRLVQNNDFIDMVYREILQAHQT